MPSALEPFTPDLSGLRWIAADPVITEYRDALYVPFRDWAPDSDPDWGLYDGDGQLIAEAAYCRGPDRRPVGQSARCTLPGSAFAPGPEEALIYAGPLIFHYGHFLLATLSRLWPFDADPSLRFLWLSPAGLEILPHTPHVGACLAGLGFDPGQFRRFDRPTRIPRLTVVAPAVEEEHFAHRAFAEMCRRIGERLVPRWDRSPGPPAYLARTGLRAAVKTLANEDAICAALAALGVEIVQPETLTLAEQIRLFGSDRVLLGIGGSAFHTCAFAPPRARMVTIELRDPANQVLLNRLGGHAMLHLRPRAPWPATGAGAIETLYTCPDPAAVARDLLHAARSQG